MVMGMGAVIILLCGLLMLVIAQNETQPISQTMVKPKVEVPQAVVDIVVAKTNINKGMRVVSEMLITKKIPMEGFSQEYLSASGVSLILGKIAKSDIKEGEALKSSDFLAANIEAELAPFYIPPGHRAISITVDGRTGVEGYAKPGTRVDVLWFFTNKSGKAEVTTIVPFAKVLSVAGATEVAGAANVKESKTTATLLVTRRQAHKIELARNTGTLMLSLVGSEERVETETTKSNSEKVTMKDMLGAQRTSRPDAVMSIYDRKTGKMEKYVFNEDNELVLAEEKAE
jgi:pilus assembly protein CpaB